MVCVNKAPAALLANHLRLYLIETTVKCAQYKLNLLVNSIGPLLPKTMTVVFHDVYVFYTIGLVKLYLLFPI